MTTAIEILRKVRDNYNRRGKLIQAATVDYAIAQLKGLTKMHTNYDNFTTTELIRQVDNNPNATPLERELVERIVRVQNAIHNITNPEKGTKNEQQELDFGGLPHMESREPS